MKFGQYVIEDEILNKETGKKSRKLKECSCDDYERGDNDTSDEFEEHTKILHTVMRSTQKLLETESILEKTEMVLFICNLLTTHINRFLKTDDERDVEMVSEKKKST